MINNKTFLYSVAFLSMTVPVQGRFIYGVIIVLELILLELAGTLLKSLSEKLKFNEISTYFVMMILVCLTILYRQILAMTYSEAALTMGFAIYFPTVSEFLFYTVFQTEEETLSKRLTTNLIKVLKFSLPILISYLFRDVAGFGTFTFFGSNHKIFEKVILNPDKIGMFMFFASIPGSLILSGALIYLCIFAKNKIIQYAPAETDKEVKA